MKRDKVPFSDHYGRLEIPYPYKAEYRDAHVCYEATEPMLIYTSLPSWPEQLVKMEPSFKEVQKHFAKSQAPIQVKRVHIYTNAEERITVKGVVAAKTQILGGYFTA
ncbi:unnamed protein product, partial [marine sediment metagenome]